MSDSTLRVSALLSVRSEIVGWEAGVRLGARAGAGAGAGVEGAEETNVTSPPPPSLSPPEDEGGVCSKSIPSSRRVIEKTVRELNSEADISTD